MSGLIEPDDTLDDDVTIGEDFLARVVELFRQPGMEDVGGKTGLAGPR